MEVGQIVNIKIESLSFGGSGVGRHESFVIFTPFTAPQDEVAVRVLSVKKNYAEAELVKIFSSSAKRVTPRCSVFGQCGGCQWQHVDYKEQLAQKQGIVEHTLARIAREENLEIGQIVPSPRHFNYRNRAQVRTSGPSLGFYERRSHQLVQFDQCHLLDEKINLEIESLKNKIQKAPTYSNSRLELTLHDQVVNVTSSRQDPNSHFSQVNALQNQNLINYVLELAGSPLRVDTDNVGFEGNALDLYCGSGNFSFPLHAQGWRIYGVDSSKNAIRQARSAATPLTFFSASDCVIEVKKLVGKNRHFELILLDPPRTGLEESLTKLIPHLKSRKIIYISCNPTTFARDWARMKSYGNLQLESVQPFDMFPQTFHVELVALIKSNI